MSKLHDYLQVHAQCLPREASGPAAVDVVHFKVVGASDADAETLRTLVANHVGEFAGVNVFDGDEHDYIELGAWLGSQRHALMLIGLGTQLGLWTLLSPKTMLGEHVDGELEQQLAGQGLISLQAPRPVKKDDARNANQGA
jgi:hypothetical protein